MRRHYSEKVGDFKIFWREASGPKIINNENFCMHGTLQR